MQYIHSICFQQRICISLIAAFRSSTSRSMIFYKRHIKIMLEIIMAALVGLIVFLVIWNTTSLNVKNDAWIMATYVEGDILQHYAGWIGFRNSPWAFPLGLASDIEYGQGTIITFTDSLPWVAMFFKLFRGLLPETFQYFGIYMLMCCILQAIAGYKLLYFKTRDISVSIMGMTLLCFAPIFMERGFRHTGLASQWLILFAIFLWQKHRAQYKHSHYLWFTLLLSLAIGIHPYFLPMVAVFLFLCMAEDLLKRNYISIILCAVALCVTYGCGILIGALGSGIHLPGGGFGHFSMNLNAPLNPRSAGGYTWSIFFKVHKQILGNYDGFNYVGAGVVFGLFVIFMFFLFYPQIKSAKIWALKNFIFIILMIVCTLFAISNVVTFNDSILFQVSLKEEILNLCALFRASSRLFYPVYYCIFVGVICTIWRYQETVGSVRSRVLILLILIIQLCDLYPCIIQKHKHMIRVREFKSILDDNDMINALHNSSYVILDRYKPEVSKHELRNFYDIRSLAIAALKNNNRLLYGFANRSYKNIRYTIPNEAINCIRTSGNDCKYFIATSDSNLRNIYMKEKNTICITRDKHYYLLADKIMPTEELSFYLTDVNWVQGISRHFSGFFVPNEQKHKNIYKVGNIVLFKNNEVREIVKTQDAGAYLHVFVEGPKLDAQHFGRPDTFKVQMVNADFYLTDANWVHGVARRWAGFYVPNTQKYRELYQLGRTVVFKNGDSRKIIRTHADRGYLQVYVEGDILDARRTGRPDVFTVRH